MLSKEYNIENALGFLMNRSGRMMGKTLMKKFEEKGFEFSGGEWPILVHLWIQDGRHQKDLTEIMCRDKGTIARIIQGLERENLLVRIADESDKRSKRIFLTHKGKSIRKQLIPLAVETTLEAIQDIPQEEILICKKVLNKIFENLSK
jgi:DNA-binding MarR family transcriptional regulator